MKTSRTIMGMDVAKHVFQVYWVDVDTGEGHCQSKPAPAQGRFVLSKNFRRNNGLGSMLDLAARMG